MNRGFGIVAQNVVRDDVIARGIAVRRRRQKRELLCVPQVPVEKDSVVAIRDLIAVHDAVSAVPRNDAVIPHVLDRVVAHLGVFRETEKDGVQRARDFIADHLVVFAE